MTPSSWPPPPPREGRSRYAVLLFNPVEGEAGWRWEQTVTGTYRWALTAWLAAYWIRVTRLHPMGFIRVTRHETDIERGPYR